MNHGDPVDLDHYKRTRREARPTPKIEHGRQGPQLGLSGLIRQLVDVAVAVHVAKHHGERVG